MTAEFKTPRCDAVMLFRDDDRYAGIEMLCESTPGHTGWHSHAMTACDPIAELTWWTAREIDDSDIEEGSEFDGPICI